MEEELDVFLNDFYGKYNNETLTQEKRSAIKKTYGDDIDTLIKDLYAKYNNETVSDDKRNTIVDTYSLKKKEGTTSPSTVQEPNSVSDGPTESVSLDIPAVDQQKNRPESQSERINSLLDNQPTSVFAYPDSPLAKEYEAIKAEYASRPPMQVEHSDLLERLEAIQPKEKKTLLQIRAEDVRTVRNSIAESEVRAKAIAKATGKDAKDILKGDENYKQLKLQEERIKGNDWGVRFLANLFDASAGISGTPGVIVESIGRLFMDEDDYEKIPQEYRQQFFTDLLKYMPVGPGSLWGPLAEKGNKRQKELLAEADDLNELATKYDTAISQDLFVNRDFAQAGKRMAVEGVASIPSLIQAMMPYVGLATIASGTASNKLQQNNEAGKTGKNAVADAWVNGASEGLLEAVTRGIANKAIKAFGNSGEEAARSMAKSLFDNLVWTPTKEGLSETATSVINKMSEAFVLGDEVKLTDAIYEAADSFLIGTAVGGPMGTVTAVGEGIQRNQRAINGDQEARDQLLRERAKDPDMADSVPLDIPVSEDTDVDAIGQEPVAEQPDKTSKIDPEETEADLPSDTQESQETGPEPEVNLPLQEVSETAETESEPTKSNVPSEGKTDDAQEATSPTAKKVTSKGFGGKDAEYDVSFDDTGRVSKITSPKTGKEIPKFVERKQRDGSKKLVRNASFTRIEADATGTITENQAKEERQKKLNQALDDFVPTNHYEMAMDYFARGGLVNTDNLQKETGYSFAEVSWAKRFGKIANNKDLPSVERVAEQLDLENSPDVRNAILEVMHDFGGREDIQDAIIDRFDEKSAERQEQELRAYVSGLDEKEFAKFEYNKAEKDYLSELSDEDVTAYFEEQYGTEERQVRPTDQDSETKDTGPQERDGAPKESRRTEESQETEVSGEEPIDLDIFGDDTGAENNGGPDAPLPFSAPKKAPKRITKNSFDKLVGLLQKAIPAKVITDAKQVSERLQQLRQRAQLQVLPYKGVAANKRLSARFEKAKELFDNGTPLSDIWEKTGFFLRKNTRDGQWEWSYRIDQNQMKVSLPNGMEGLAGKKKRLGDLVDYREFFAIFPKARDITVEFYSDPKGGNVAEMHPDTNTLKVNTSKYESQQGTRNDIAHELQHYVQYKVEQGTPRSPQRIREEVKSRLDTRRRDLGVLVLNSTGKEKADYERRLNNVKKAISYLNGNENVPDDIKIAVKKELDKLYFSSRVEREARLAETDYTKDPYQSQLEDSDGLKITKTDFEAETAPLRNKGGEQLLQTPDGEVYGFVDPDTGNIYIDPENLNANTPIHEFGHLWINALKKSNPSLYRRGKDLIKGSKYLDEVRNNPAYDGLTAEQKQEEALATAIGDKGEQLVTSSDRSRFRQFLEKVREFITDTFFANQKDKLDQLTLDQFLDSALGDLLGGKKIEFEAQKIDSGQGNQKPPTKKTKPKKDGFVPKPGQKSLLTRAATGGANKSIVDALKKHGLTYTVESQTDAQKRAKAFVKDVGVEKAAEMLKSGVMKPGAELAFIYSEVIDGLEAKMDTTSEKDMERFRDDYLKLQEDIFVSFDNTVRDLSRFIAALNKVYNSSNYKYNLTKQIKDYKARNPDKLDEAGNIPADVMKRLEERDKLLKDHEKRINELEEKLAKAEADQAVEDIDEYNQRQLPKRHTRSSRKRAASALRKTKFVQNIKDTNKLQNDPLGLFKGVWDGAIEIVATALEKSDDIELAIKKGINHIKRSEWYKGLSSKDKKTEEEKFKNHVQSVIDSNIIEDEFDVYIDDDGKIKVPAKLIRQYVAEGIKDADELARKIIDTYLQGEDVTLREVRDAITGYGRKINPSLDELSQEVSKMKNLGRVLSGMEDVSDGKRPLRSGLQRRKKEDIERRKERDLKDAMRDLGVDETDSENRWKTQLQTIKTRLENQIRDLEQQIKNKERSKPERRPIEYDAEAKELARQRDELKQRLENIVGKPEMSPEDKVKMVERGLEQQIEKLNAKIKSGDLSYAAKGDPIASARITELRKIRDERKAELDRMRAESGVIEKRRLDQRKKAVAKRLAELQEKRKNKDYSKKQRKAPPEDAELKKLQSEYNREKEKYDQEAYEDELRKKHWLKKVGRQVINAFGMQRVLLATGEFSFVFLQNALPTVNLLVRNPKKLGRIFVNTLKSYSKTNFDNYQAQLEGNELYDLAVKNKVAFTKSNYKLAAAEEVFQGDMVSAFIKVLADSADWDGNKRLTLYNTMLKYMGVDTSNKDRFSIAEQINNANPLGAMERFTTAYSNAIKMHLFEQSVRMLEAEGKNPLDNKDDYRRSAKAINTLTGRAELGSYLESTTPILNALFFSARFAVSTFNKLNPFWYAYTLRDAENPTKVSAAQKMAISQGLTYIGTTTAFILAIQLLAGKDEDDEWIVQIEADPRSSDFMKMKIDNIRFDPWGGHLPWVVLASRIATGEIKKSSGKVATLGQGGEDTVFDKIVDFGVGKANPTMASIIRWTKSSEDADGTRRDKYGNEVSLEEEVDGIRPIYWQGVKEVLDESPEKGRELTYALTALGLLGVNNQVYGKSPADYFKSYSSDTKKEESNRKSQVLKSSTDGKSATEKELSETFDNYIEMHENNGEQMLKRIEKEIRLGMTADDIRGLLKQAGYSKRDIRRLANGQYPEIRKISKTVLENRVESMKSRLKKSEQGNFEAIKAEMERKRDYFNQRVREYQGKDE